jgi:uncharacterized protein (TIGR00297 family)
MTSDTRREVIRKILHMAMGLFALCLRWLTPWQAALCAIAALAHNLWLFPHYGYGKLLRPEEKARGYSGMLGYPAVVLALILLSADPRTVLSASWKDVDWRANLAVAAAAWAVLAFGDAAAALSGMALGGPRLPWNGKKTWSCWLGFTLVGGSLSALWYAFVSGRPLGGAGGGAIVVTALMAALLAGLVETLPGQLDDNLSVPLMAWLVFSFCDAPGLEHLRQALAANLPGANGPWPVWVTMLLGANLALGLTAYKLGWVGGPSCALGILFGSMVVVGAGWQGYALLLAFYLLSQLSTFFGGRVKRRRGIAEPDGGRRGVGSVFSKGFLPALFSLVSPLAFVAALATYAADTVASEVGKASDGKARLLFRRKPVPHGTVGAISVAGTLAGLAVIALFVVLAGVLGGRISPRFFLADDYRVFSGDGAFLSVGIIDLTVLLFCAAAASLTAFIGESLLNEKVVDRGWVSKEIGHLFTGGLAGSLTFGIAAVLVALLGKVT